MTNKSNAQQSTESASNLALLRMLQVSDSMFPIGSFTLSDGLETFVAERRINSISDLREYAESYLTILTYNDLAGLIQAFNACDAFTSFEEKILELDRFMYVWKGPMEVREGSKKLCSRFIKIWDNLSEFPKLAAYKHLISSGKCIGIHSLAIGLYAYDVGISVSQAAEIYTYQKMSALVTNAVKTVPLSQIQGQTVLSECLKKIPAIVSISKSLRLEDMGLGGTMFDIEAMRHEQLYSRLYMS